MTHSTIYVGENSHVVELVDLKNHEDVAQLTATVELTSIVDSETSAAPAGLPTLPLSLAHVGLGTYRAILAPISGIQVGRIYLAKFNATTSPDGLVGEWTERCVARVRSN